MRLTAVGASRFIRGFYMWLFTVMIIERITRKTTSYLFHSDTGSGRVL